MPYVSFAGNDIEPIWVTAEDRTVIGWWRHEGRRDLLVGLDVVGEIVRYTQGDPKQVKVAENRSMWGFGHERPVYLYKDNVHPDYELEPWADRLGFLLAETLGRWLDVPLLSPLPEGAKGAVMLTGDDDEAYLEKYDEQLRHVGDFPMTYFMLPQTRHTPQTLAKFPKNVELGLHVDALDHPDQYDDACRKQLAAVFELTGKTPRTIRNHGHLSREYCGHLGAWEECGLDLDLNIPGMCGVVRTGSLLPFRILRPDGRWSPHYSLLSGYADAMTIHLKWSGRKQQRRIRRQARRVEQLHPGVLVFNMHPQKVSDNLRSLRTIMQLGRRPGWVALGADSYLSWLKAIEKIRLKVQAGGRPVLAGAEGLPGLKTRVWRDAAWHCEPVHARP